MLEPQQRSTIYDVVRPPFPDWSVDALVICTYSVALNTVLSLPAAILADMPGLQMRAEGAFSPQQLAALRRICDRTLIFCQMSAIHSAVGMTPAVIEAEKMIYEVEAPNGGAFHPKVWVIRFRDPKGEKTLLRVAISSRNLTSDPSWDLAVILDGTGSIGVRESNDLGHFLRCLPAMRNNQRPLSRARAAMLEELADMVEQTRWRLPPGLTKPSFHAIGVKDRGGWQPPSSDRLAVLSPFLHVDALDALQKTTATPAFLISRIDAIDRTWSAASAFRHVAVLSPPQNDEGGRVGSDLHAKAFFWQTGKRAAVALGSMNATTPAMAGTNVEFMASFDCTSALKDGGIDSLLDHKMLGLVTTEYAPPENAEEAPAPFDDRPAKRALAALELNLECRREKDRWRLVLRTKADITPALISMLPALRFRPTTLGKSEGALCLHGLAAAGEAIFPRPLELAEITGFIAFEAGTAEEPIRFTLNLDVSGVSDDERREAVVHAIVRDEQSFVDFVRGQLGDFSSLELAGGAEAGLGGGEEQTGLAMRAGPGLLELLVRCACDAPERLRDIDATITSLGAASTGVVPKAFAQIWRAMVDATRPAR
ncbi:MAG: phospholipase D family protein [Sphingomonas sp.]